MVSVIVAAVATDERRRATITDRACRQLVCNDRGARTAATAATRRTPAARPRHRRRRRPRRRRPRPRQRRRRRRRADRRRGDRARHATRRKRRHRRRRQSPTARSSRTGPIPTQGVLPLTEENALKPWERVGMTEDEWNELTEADPRRGQPGRLGGLPLRQPVLPGVYLDEDGELQLLEIQETGLNPGRCSELLGVGGKALSATRRGAARAAIRMPAAARAALIARGVLPSVARDQAADPAVDRPAPRSTSSTRSAARPAPRRRSPRTCSAPAPPRRARSGPPASAAGAPTTPAAT